MKRVITAIALCVGLALPTVALAQPEGPTPVFMQDAGPEVGSNEDIKEKLGETYEQVQEVREASDQGLPTKALWFALIAAGSNLLISVVKRVRRMTKYGKRWLPLVAAGLGAVTGLTSMMTAGAALPAALLYGLAPPLGVFLHELYEALTGKRLKRA